jgi:Tol biopolymer transport system component/DNA-binding winged helix-turn-helix (wHTH) protein
VDPKISAGTAPNQGPLAAPTKLAFGAFELDVAVRKLLRDGQPVTLPSRALDALTYLISHRNRLIDKEELISAVWPDVVVTDDSLIHAISVLRRVLSDDPTNAQFIETIPRRGYRFIGAIAPAGDSSKPNSAPSGASTIEANPSPPPPMRPPAATRALHARSLWATAALSVLLTGLAFATLLRSPARESESAMRLFQPPPLGTSIVSSGVLSPDGQQLAFVARDERSGKTALWVRTLSSSEARRLPGTDGASKPFWSPDARQLAFFGNGKLSVVEPLGERARTIASVDSAAAGGTWGPDDVILFADWPNGLYSVPALGEGGVTAVTRLDPSAREIAHAWPQFLPDGRHYIYQIVSLDAPRTGIYVGDLATRETFQLLTTESPAVFAPPRHILHVQNGMLIAEELDLEDLTLTGRSILLARGLSPPSLADGDVGSASRSLVAFREGRREQNLAWFDRDGGMLGALAVPTVLFNPRLSPDERYVLATGSLTTSPGLWLASLARPEFRKIETDAIAPLWSPDGKRVAFTSRDGLDLVVRETEADGAVQPLIRNTAVMILNDWSPDGRELVYTQAGANGNLDLWIASIAAGTVRPLFETPFNEMQARISPDGRWIAYTSDESGTLEVYIDRYPGRGERRRMTVDGGGQPQWRADQRELFFVSADGALMSIEVEATDTLSFGAARKLFRPPLGGGPENARDYYAVTADGQRFLVDGAVEDGQRGAITILVNWTAATSASASLPPSAWTSRVLR